MMLKVHSLAIIEMYQLCVYVCAHTKKVFVYGVHNQKSILQIANEIKFVYTCFALYVVKRDTCIIIYIQNFHSMKRESA